MAVPGPTLPGAPSGAQLKKMKAQQCAQVLHQVRAGKDEGKLEGFGGRGRLHPEE